MSLDLYLRSIKPVRHRGTGVFTRDNGTTKELKTLEEVREHFSDADLSDVKIYDYEDDELFCMNLTHNLTEMAGNVPIDGTDGVMTLPKDHEKGKPDFKPEPLSAYNLLWHPETNPLLRKGTFRHRTSDGDEFEDDGICLDAEFVRQLMAVYHYIANNRQRLEKFNPDNGWGTYEQLRDRTKELLMAILGIPVEDYGEYYIHCWT